MGYCCKAWTTTVVKSTLIHCSCRKSWLKQQMWHSFVWTSLAGNHNHCLIITLYFPPGWPLLLSSYCMGYQSYVTLVRSNSYCGDKIFHQTYEHTDSSWKTLPIPTFSLQVLLCVITIMNLKYCGGFLLQVLAIHGKNGREVAWAPTSYRDEALSLCNACQGSHWQMWGTVASKMFAS